MMNPLNVSVLVGQSKFYGPDTNTAKHTHKQILWKINTAWLDHEVGKQMNNRDKCYDILNSHPLSPVTKCVVSIVTGIDVTGPYGEHGHLINISESKLKHNWSLEH